MTGKWRPSITHASITSAIPVNNTQAAHAQRVRAIDAGLMIQSLVAHQLWRIMNQPSRYLMTDQHWHDHTSCGCIIDFKTGAKLEAAEAEIDRLEAEGCEQARVQPLTHNPKPKPLSHGPSTASSLGLGLLLLALALSSEWAAAVLLLVLISGFASFRES